MRPTTAVVVTLAVLGPRTCAAILKRLALAILVLFLAFAAFALTLPTAPGALHDALTPSEKIAVCGAVVWAVLRGVAWVLDAAAGS